MNIFSFLFNTILRIKEAKSSAKDYTDIAEQNAKDYTDTSVSAITDNIKNLTIVKTSNISDIDASSININDEPRIMFFYNSSQVYISFDYYWIRLQIRSNSRYTEARTIYGATVGTWTRI